MYLFRINTKSISSSVIIRKIKINLWGTLQIQTQEPYQILCRMPRDKVKAVWKGKENRSARNLGGGGAIGILKHRAAFHHSIKYAVELLIHGKPAARISCNVPMPWAQKRVSMQDLLTLEIFGAGNGI